MVRALMVLTATGLASALGCAMCANPHDCKYAAYGGLRQRADRVHGRVASVFDPAAELPPAAGQPVGPAPQAARMDQTPDGETDAATGHDVAPSPTPQTVPGVAPVEPEELPPFSDQDVPPQPDMDDDLDLEPPPDTLFPSTRRPDRDAPSVWR